VKDKLIRIVRHHEAHSPAVIPRLVFEIPAKNNHSHFYTFHREMIVYDFRKVHGKLKAEIAQRAADKDHAGDVIFADAADAIVLNVLKNSHIDRTRHVSARDSF